MKDEKNHDKDGADVVINGEAKQVPSRTVTYAEVVELAFPGFGQDANSTFVVLYRKSDGARAEGSMVAGDSVKVHKQGSSFNVTRSIRS